MDTKELHAFTKVYECRSIHLAAQSLYISSQGLGKIISRLETELGVSLFTRTPTGVTPTVYADRIYSHAAIIERELKAIENVEIDQTRNLSVGFTNGLYRILTLRFFQELQEKYPDIHVTSCDGTDAVLERRLWNDELDLCFLSAPIDLTRYNAVPFISVGLCFVTNAQNPLSAKKEIDISDLKDETLIISSRDFAVYSLRSNDLNHAGISGDHLIETMDPEFHIMSVEQGYASTFMMNMPEFIPDDPRIIRIPLKSPEKYEWSVMLTYKKNRDISSDESAFIKFSMNWIRQNRPELLRQPKR